MRIRDWSSGVCSSDLPPTPITAMRGFSSSTCVRPILMLIRYSPCSGEPLPPALPCDPPDGGPAARIPVTALHYCDAGITQKINLSRSLRSKTAFERRRQPMKDRRALRTVDVLRHHRQIAQVDREIGRAHV